VNNITIVLADDHQVVRQGLRALLEAENDFRIVGEAGDGVEAVRLVENLKPKVLVADLMMPGLKGLEVLHQVGRRVLETRVVILSMYANEAYVLEALRNGAAAYVLKESSAADLVKAVRESVAGRRFLSAPLSERAIEAYAQKAAAKTHDPYDTLSPREREVLHLAAESHTNTEIATRLYISPRTVESHRANVMHKLGLHSHTDLIRFALQRGILLMDTQTDSAPLPGKKPKD
jgi:DNA-binding NarL/FixJ family response regulator